MVVGLDRKPSAPSAPEGAEISPPCRIIQRHAASGCTPTIPHTNPARGLRLLVQALRKRMSADWQKEAACVLVPLGSFGFC